MSGRFSAAGRRPLAALALGALAIALVLAYLLLYPRPIGERRPPSAVDHAQASVVTVISSSRVDQSSGSGFFVSSDGRILTNSHVVEDADSISVELPDRKRQRAYLVGLDSARDVAEIYTPYHSEPLTLASGNVVVGQTVYVLGNPLGDHPNSTIKGRVTSLHDSAVVDGQAYPDLINTDAQIFPGTSGGPAVDEQGRVIGMATLGDSPAGAPDGPGNASLLPNSQLSPDLERWSSLPLPTSAAA